MEEPSMQAPLPLLNVVENVVEVPSMQGPLPHRPPDDSPLLCAARLAWPEELATLLQSKRHNVAEVDARGWTCIHHLCASTERSEQKMEALKVLLRHDADVEARSASLQIGLHIAATQLGDLAFLSQLLLSRDTGARDSLGTPSCPNVVSPPVNTGGAPTLGHEEREVCPESRTSALPHFLPRGLQIGARGPDARRRHRSTRLRPECAPCPPPLLCCEGHARLQRRHRMACRHAYLLVRAARQPGLRRAERARRVAALR